MKQNTNEYPYIRAWHQIAGSNSEYIEQQVELARQENAPYNAVFRNIEKPIWYTIDQIGKKSTKTAVIELAKRLQAGCTDSERIQ